MVSLMLTRCKQCLRTEIPGGAGLCWAARRGFQPLPDSGAAGRLILALEFICDDENLGLFPTCLRLFELIRNLGQQHELGTRGGKDQDITAKPVPNSTLEERGEAEQTPFRRAHSHSALNGSESETLHWKSSARLDWVYKALDERPRPLAWTQCWISSSCSKITRNALKMPRRCFGNA